MLMPYFSYGFNGSIGTHVCPAFGSILVHDTTLTVPFARLNLLPDGCALNDTAVFPIAILNLLPFIKTVTFCIPTPEKVVDAKGVAPKNIMVSPSKFE